ncbi:DUF2183 domain-containing protein [Bacteriovoracaceae bacterium]|nr:DUF2183 domain-containing protein [Bacteriovoracaceae bacterium]
MKNLLLITALLWSCLSFSKVIVVSDIDDTIKETNTMSPTGKIYYFLRNKPFKHMSAIYRELDSFYKSSGEDIEFFYVSAAPDFIFNQQKFLRKYRFPMGKTFLKKISSPETYAYKYLTIKQILEANYNEGDTVIFLGDNSEHDPAVYVDITNNLNLENAEILVRDVSTQATNLASGLGIKRLPGVQYFFSEMELAEAPVMHFLSNKTLGSIAKDYKAKSLVPSFTLKTLETRLEKKLNCKDRSCKRYAEKKAKKIFGNYYLKYSL